MAQFHGLLFFLRATSQADMAQATFSPERLILHWHVHLATAARVKDPTASCGVFDYCISSAT